MGLMEESLSPKISGHQMVYCCDRIYLICGKTENENEENTLIFSFSESDRLITKVKLEMEKQSCSNFGLCSKGNKTYVFGGKINKNGATIRNSELFSIHFPPLSHWTILNHHLFPAHVDYFVCFLLFLRNNSPTLLERIPRRLFYYMISFIVENITD